MDLSEESIMSRLNCHNVGRIIEFDPATQLCTVEMLQIKQFNDQYITPAPLTEVPLIILGAGGANITLPDPVGTVCLILFMDRNIDAFIETGETYTPDTARMHDFTDAVAISTIKTLVNPIKDYDTETVTIQYQNSNIKVKDAISLNAKNDININSVSKIVLNSSDVKTTGNFSVATGYSGIIAAGAVSIQVTNGIITGAI